MATLETAYPDWTEYRKKSGLDPLGMQNGSINLYQRLVPGVSNVTLRIRYYGFYAWLAELYAKNSGNTDRTAWQTFVRRSEALYALTAAHVGGDGGVAGILRAQEILAGSEENILFSPHADPNGSATPYLQQRWGAYGAAYASQLTEMGIFTRVAQHLIPINSAELGDKLSKAFGEAVGDAGELFRLAVERGTTTRKELTAFGVMLPSEIDPTGAERQIYQDILFANAGLRRPSDVARCETMLLLLQTAAHRQGIPEVNDVRWLLYANADDEGLELEVSRADLREQQRRWRIYQANDLLHFSYETLMKFVLDILESHPSGLGLAALIAEAVSSILEAASQWPATWNEFRTAVIPAENAYSSSNLNAEYSLVEKIYEGVGSAKKSTNEAAWAALKLLVVVQNRVAVDESAVKAELGGLDPQGFHTLITEVAFLQAHEDEPFSRIVARIIEERVVNRHLWVAHRKFRLGDYTFLIEIDDGRLRRRADGGPLLTNPRLASALAFLTDIHLIGDDGLSADALALLEAA